MQTGHGDRREYAPEGEERYSWVKSCRVGSRGDVLLAKDNGHQECFKAGADLPQGFDVRVQADRT